MVALLVALVAIAWAKPEWVPAELKPMVAKLGLSASPAGKLAGAPSGAPGAPGAAPAGGPPGAGAPRPIAVEAIAVRLDKVQVTLSAVGTLRADEQVTISPEIEGRIAEIGFEEGKPVDKDRVLFRLDDVILKAEASQSRAELSLAEANFDRADTLLRQRSGTERQRDEAKYVLDKARANVELAASRLDKATVRAPFAGIVGLRAIGLGEYVTRGETIVTLQRIDPLKVDFRLPETDLGSVAVGQSLRINVDALPGKAFDGKIYAIDPQVDVNGRAIQLRADVPNPAGVLRPGLFARVELIAAARDQAMLVPESAIIAQGRDRFVYVVKDGKALRARVETGWRRPGEVEILSGIGKDDIVVTSGHQRLRDGAVVEIIGKVKA
ncbi:MAG: efflux RND transporter periplasmic adaptor subunit [Hyphomicrobiaceae bacterium]|nr:efflux RND transporter periplasmic adaptor subunit [Hyphomicrobiaceae bacterium]